MKRNLYLSALVFLFPFVLGSTVWLTQLAMGAVRLDDAPFIITLGFVVSFLMATVFYFSLMEFKKRFNGKPDKENYKPSKRYFIFAAAVLVVSLVLGVNQGRSVSSRQLKIAELQSSVEAKKLQRIEAEKQRIAAMSPEQLAEEKRKKDEMAKSIALEAAQKDSNIESCRAEVVEAVRKLGYKPNADFGNLFLNSFSRFQESGYIRIAEGVHLYSVGVEADYSSTGELTWFDCEVDKNGRTALKKR